MLKSGIYQRPVLYRLDRLPNDNTEMEWGREKKKESTIQVGRVGLLQLIIYQSIDSTGAGMMDLNQKWAL